MTLEKPTNIPTTRYHQLFGACLKNLGVLAVYPTPKFSGRRAGISIGGGALVCRNNIVLDISDKEK